MKDLPPFKIPDFLRKAPTARKASPDTTDEPEPTTPNTIPDLAPDNRDHIKEVLLERASACLDFVRDSVFAEGIVHYEHSDPENKNKYSIYIRIKGIKEPPK